MMPSCSHVGTPRHFQSSTTSGTAALAILRTRARTSPRQSPSSLMRSSISREGCLALVVVFLAGGIASSYPLDHDQGQALASERRVLVDRAAPRAGFMPAILDVVLEAFEIAVGTRFHDAEGVTGLLDEPLGVEVEM